MSRVESRPRSRWHLHLSQQTLLWMYYLRLPNRHSGSSRYRSRYYQSLAREVPLRTSVGHNHGSGPAEGSDEPSAPAAVDGATALDGQRTSPMVQRNLSRKLSIQPSEKPEELLVAVARMALSDHTSAEDLQRGEQRGGSVAFIILRHRPAPALLER